MLIENWTKSSRSSRIAVLAGLILIGAFAVYNWIVAPHMNCLMAAQGYEFVLDDLAKKKLVVSNNVKIKTEEVEQLQEKLKQACADLYDPVEAARFFSNIQNLAESAGCVVNTLNFPPTNSLIKNKKTQTDIYVTSKRALLSFTGNYKDITELINKLQDRPGKVRLDSIKIKYAPGGSGRLKCDAAVTVYVLNNRKRGSHD